MRAQRNYSILSFFRCRKWTIWWHSTTGITKQRAYNINSSWVFTILIIYISILIKEATHSTITQMLSGIRKVNRNVHHPKQRKCPAYFRILVTQISMISELVWLFYTIRLDKNRRSHYFCCVGTLKYQKRRIFRNSNCKHCTKAINNQKVYSCVFSLEAI